MANRQIHVGQTVWLKFWKLSLITQKHCGEMRKCRLPAFFSFPQNIFKSLISQACFNPFPNKPWFLRVCSTSIFKTLWEKEKLLVMSNFSFSHSVFYHLGSLSIIFIKFEIVVCNFFQLRRV